jgi:Tfp pilus assembly protein PilO
MARVDMASVRERLKVSRRDPRLVVRLVLGALVFANLVAAVLILKPWAGSAEDLERRAATLRQTLRLKQTSLERLRGIVNKVQSARGDGDNFMDGYLLSRRWVSSRLLRDLDGMARKASIRQKEVSFGFEPVEGSDTLIKATMTANYEGTYSDLVHFLNLLDRSPRLLIIESLAATPQPQGLVLNTTMKFNAFVREGGDAPDEEALEEAPEAENAQPASAPPRQTGTAPDTAPDIRPEGPPPPEADVENPPADNPAGPPQARRSFVPIPLPGVTPQPGQEMAPQRPPFAGPRVLRERLRGSRPSETESSEQ